MITESGNAVAPRTGGRGLKYVVEDINGTHTGRPPHRGAWIEIGKYWCIVHKLGVAPRTGGRGLKSKLKAATITAGDVAPRTGGRGLKSFCTMFINLSACRPPHRGAWIEIVIF